MTLESTALEGRVLVAMPTERDTERTMQLLGGADIASVRCSTEASLRYELERGAGAILLTDDVFAVEKEGLVAELLHTQPAWSAIPILVLTREGDRERRRQGIFEGYTGVVIVERPVRARSLVSAIHSALRARRNQYAIRDAILERERQAAALLEQDEKLRFALDAARLGSWEVDLEREELTCSDLCKESYGRPLDQPFTYDELRACVHEDDRDRVASALRESIATGTSYDTEYRVRWPDGETHWVMARGRAVYDAQKRPVRMVGVSLDVTERERLVEALQHSESQLRAADRKKDEFLATLAHELRNPLAPIRTGISIVSQSSDPEAAQRALGVMDRQVAHMVRLIDDLLDVSRITQGKLALKRGRVTLATILETAIEGSGPNLERGGHTLRTDFGDPTLVVDGDHTRLAQVVSNLLNNACKYTPSHGTIELSAARDGNHVAITVQDDGVGIPQDHLGDIFDMFGQVERVLDRSQGGLGIGLALVRKLVELHGGTVVAKSAGPDQGSTFVVRLPLVDAAPLEVAVPHGRSEPPSAGNRVLVVDDNDDAAELLALMLQHAGYVTETACDGPEALDAASMFAPDIVILDIGLPKMSGYEVAARLRKDASLERTTLIALTGWGTPEDRQRAFAAGFDLHLTKPVDAGDLHAALDRASKLRRPPTV